MNLDAAVAAARAESLERASGPRLTRDRVLASSARSPRRRVHAVVAAVIASMFGATAFAWYASAPPSMAPTTPVIARAGEALAASELPATAERQLARVERTVTVAVAEPEPTVAEPKPLVAEPKPAVAEREPPVAGAGRGASTKPAARDEHDAELALYAEAHRLHFQARDPAAALAAWDRYLATAPDGRLAPEARFNRIVALVRLERWADAEAALASVDASFRPRDIERLRALISARR